MADFLERAGFLHLSGVVDTAELDELLADVTAGVAAARPDDKRSWWTTVDGVEVCNRVNYLNERSESIAGARVRRAVLPHRGTRGSRPTRCARPPRRQRRGDQGPGCRRPVSPICPGTATAGWAGTR